ncbi:MAG: hypothetical protein IPM24_10200 [Bryobacterales bacterium]|nr:hypothetical protein [Bryobacterales bacterium]
MNEANQNPESQGCFCMGAGPQASELLRHLIPDQAREHFRNSRIEVLKGLRSLIDQRIEQLSRSHKKGTTVIIE